MNTSPKFSRFIRLQLKNCLLEEPALAIYFLIMVGITIITCSTLMQSFFLSLALRNRGTPYPKQKYPICNIPMWLLMWNSKYVFKPVVLVPMMVHSSTNESLMVCMGCPDPFSLAARPAIPCEWQKAPLRRQSFRMHFYMHKKALLSTLCLSVVSQCLWPSSLEVTGYDILTIYFQ